MDNAPRRVEGVPEFTIAIRGYDRIQVDEYVARWSRWMQEAKTRTEQAEAVAARIQRENAELRRDISRAKTEGSPRAALGDLGDEIRASLEKTFVECEELRRRAQDDAERMIADAKEMALDIVDRARAGADGLSAAASEDRERAARALEKANDHATQVVSEQLGAARAEAEQLLASAREEAAAIQAEAAHRRARVLEVAERHRRAADDEVARLIVQRDHVLAQLAGLRTALEGAISAPDAPRGQDADGSNRAPSAPREVDIREVSA